MSGWNQMRSRMVGNADGHAMIVTFSTCVDSIRTIPFLQHDPDRHEDVIPTARIMQATSEICLYVAAVLA